MKKIILILILGIMGGCKDNCPDPNGSASNGSGTSGGPGTEYTIKGKLLNGTTMQPINPGMIMTLIAQNNGLAVKRVELGTCKIEGDGSFELKYLYSDVAAISTSFMRFESQFYISEYLPRNQSLDTVFYESTLGTIYFSIESKGYTDEDTLFTAIPNLNNFIEFDTITLPFNGHLKTVRTNKGKSGIDYLINDALIKYYDSESRSYSKAVQGLSLTIAGDPFVDTLKLQIEK